RALWAGGCVRDELLGLAPADYDIATDARPEQVKSQFRRCHSFGASFGVVEVLGPRGPDGEWLKVQVATFRSDGTYSDGRRPDAVTFSSPEEDAKRRDFTVNGMFFDPVRHEVIDYVGGRADLAARVLRAIGDPAERFAEDRLRTLRAARMAARFDLALDPATRDAATAAAADLRAVSAERVSDELRKVLTNRHRVRGFALFRELGLLPGIVPEILPHADVAGGVLTVLAGPTWPATESVSFPLGFAAVLHPLPPNTVADIGRRLRLSLAEIDRTVWLVANQRFPAAAPTLPPSRRNPTLVHPGIGELLALAAALGDGDGAIWCLRLLREIPTDQLNPPPLLTGDDLRAFGMAPGPRFKPLLDAIRAAQLDGEIGDREAAEHFARDHWGNGR
ncbi:MAG: CCA tRNA nucleotidyltransferase, partial [Fimbriiglobus sp.]